MFKIRNMIEDDLANVAKVHKVSFKGFFLEKMGVSFIKEYYKIVLSYEKKISIVCIDKDGDLMGFVSGFLEPSEFYKNFFKSKQRLLFPVLIGIIKNPKLIVKIFFNISRLITNKKNFHKDEYTVELSSIAVAEKSSGIGSILLKAFIDQAWNYKAKKIILTTNLHNNELANNFYINHGFKKVDLEKRRGRTLVKYSLANTQK